MDVVVGARVDVLLKGRLVLDGRADAATCLGARLPAEGDADVELAGPLGLTAGILRVVRPGELESEVTGWRWVLVVGAGVLVVDEELSAFW